MSTTDPHGPQPNPARPISSDLMASLEALIEWPAAMPTSRLDEEVLPIPVAARRLRQALEEGGDAAHELRQVIRHLSRARVCVALIERTLVALEDAVDEIPLTVALPEVRHGG